MKIKKITKKKLRLSVFLFCIIIFFVGFIVFFLFQLRPVFEASFTEVTKMPKDIRTEVINASPSATIRVPILMYHYVEYVKDKGDTIRQSLDINPNVFEAQVKTLSENGFTFMTESELADVLDNKQPLPQKPVLLTFDDGHWDLYTDVLPILQKYHAKGTAYIISGFIGNSDFLSQDQLQKVIQSGLVEIGSHTVHHIGLANVLPLVIKYEVTKSKEQLESTYHIKVVSFAYPNGSFDKQAIKAVKDAGYSSAVSTLQGVEQSQVNRFFLNRLRPGYRTGDSLLKYLQQ